MDGGLPFLWIIAAGTPRALLASFPFVPAAGWPRGVYLFDGPVIRVGLVAAAELPRDRSTVLVRLMAGGALLRAALADLRALPRDAYERVVAEPVLVRLQQALVGKRQRTQEEETLMDVYSTWEEIQAEIKQEGRVEGRIEERARSVLSVLRVRGIAVSETERARIIGEPDPERLERWHERAVTAASCAAIFDEPH